MAKKIQVEVEIKDNTGEAEGGFVRLQTRIRETKVALQEAAEAGDTQTFNALKEQLDELQDQFDKTNAQSKKFADSLATVPGPAGVAGKAIKGLDDAFKFLAANPVVATITAIGAVLFAMYKALTQTEAGTKALSRVTEAFGRILTPIIEFISAIAIPVVNAFADAINWAATKIGLVDEKLVSAQESFKEYEKTQRKLIKTLEGEIEVEETLGKTILETAGKRKAAIDAELAILDARKAAFGKLTVEEEEKYAELQQKKLVIDAQVQAKQKENAEKAVKDRQDEYKKDFESYKESFTVREKVIEANYNTEKYLLDKQKAEGLIREEQYNVKFAELEQARKTKGVLTQEEYNIKLAELQREKNAAGVLTEGEYNVKLFELERAKNEELQLEQDRAQALRLEFLKQGLEKGLITRKEYDQYVLTATTEFNNQKQELDKQGKDTEISFINDVAAKLKELRDIQIEVNKQIAQSWIELGGNLANTFIQLANLFEKGSDAQKAFAIIGVLLNSASAIGKVVLGAQEQIADGSKAISAGASAKAQGVAFLPVNPPLGGLLIGAGIAASTAGGAIIAKAKLNSALQIGAIGISAAGQIAAITAAGKGSKSAAGSASTGGTAAQAPTPAFSAPAQAPAPNIGRSAVSSEGRIGEIVTGAATEQGKRPIQTYVIGSQVSTQQQLDRRVALAAKMPG
jgi:hypothetical protein